MINAILNKNWKNVEFNGKQQDIPEDWEITKVNNVLNILTDFTSNGSFADLAEYVSYLNDVDYSRLIRLTDIRNNFKNKGVYVSKSSHDFLKKSELFGEEILIANVGENAGFCCILPQIAFKATLGPNMFLLKFNNDKTNKYFPYFFLSSKKIQNVLGNIASSTTMPKLNKVDIKSLDILVIPKKEEEEISKILWKQKELIQKCDINKEKQLKIIKKNQNILLSGKTRIKLSEEKEQELLSKGVISLVEEKTEKENFSFFNINDGKFEEFVSLVALTKDIVFYQNEESNWKIEEVNELQKQLPKDWNVEQLYKKVNFIKGKSIPENQLNYNGEGVKYLKTTEFWLDSSSKRDTVHYTGKVEEKHIKTKDEYVFSMDGFNNKIGQGTLGLISNEDEGIVSTSFYKLEKNDIYHLVVNVLKSNYVQNFIMRLGEGTTVYHAGKYMKNLQGIFPKSTVEQKLLSMIFEKEEKLVDSLKEKIKLEEKVFKYLQQELLSGRIRIKVEE